MLVAIFKSHEGFSEVFPVHIFEMAECVIFILMAVVKRLAPLIKSTLHLTFMCIPKNNSRILHLRFITKVNKVLISAILMFQGAEDCLYIIIVEMTDSTTFLIFPCIYLEWVASWIISALWQAMLFNILVCYLRCLFSKFLHQVQRANIKLIKTFRCFVLRIVLARVSCAESIVFFLF